MTTPNYEAHQFQYSLNHGSPSLSDEEGNLSGEHNRLHNTSSHNNSISEEIVSLGGKASHSQTREQEHRLNDDLAMLQAEREVSHAQDAGIAGRVDHSTSMQRSRSRVEPVDQFATNSELVKAATFKPPEHPKGNFAKAFKKIHESNFLVRYFSYIVPVVVIILIPLLLGALLYHDATVGDVRMMWFCVWLEIVWLTLWSGRITAHILPYPVGVVFSLFTNNSKKWKDMSRQLEIPATIFFWALAVEISFLPTMKNHHIDGITHTRDWEVKMNKVLVSILVGASLNLIEKVIIQLIAISFHLRTYSDRIDINKFQIGSLTKLYQYSKEKIAADDSDFEEKNPSGPGSGARTPMQYVEKAQKQARGVFNKFGDVAGKVAGDFTGRGVTKSTHPRQVVLTLLSSTSGSQVLARRLYRTFVREGADTIVSEDLKHSFDNDEEAENSFSMFDRDMNGDISMSELEAVCVEIGRERKSITASLKDLDSVVSKLDAVLLFFVVGITILVLLSLISTSAAASLTSAGSAVLALSWLFSATAQEFLASCIFVLVKHPFDCGDRVYIYGNSGSQMKGDDYFVKEISLLYTEFKKMEGHIVQAPNSYLNTLFIQNMRRTGSLAEAVPLTVKFGTTLDQIDDLRQRLLEFVKSEKREYQPNILTEIRDVVEAHSVNLNVVFFYKSNWQNELLRLQRRNKFICAMMLSMQAIGIEGPLKRLPGQKAEAPYYVHYSNPMALQQQKDSDNHDQSALGQETSFSPRGRDDSENGPMRSGSRQLADSLHSRRPRNESISAMAKRVDFSLGIKDVSSGDIMGDLYDDKGQNTVIGTQRGSFSHSRDMRNIAEEKEEDPREETLDRSSSKLKDMGSRYRLHRTSTESGSRMKRGLSAIRSNRLFPRHGRKNSTSEYEDLMEQGVQESSEASGNETPRSRQYVSKATRTATDSDTSHGVLPGSDLGQRADRHNRGEHGLPGLPTRSQTESFELKDLERQ